MTLFVQTLGEVISVTASMNDGRKCNVYGTITVNEFNPWFGPVVVYNRTRDKSELTEDGKITLNPTRAIRCEVQYVIKAELYQNNDCEMDEIICNGNYNALRDGYASVDTPCIREIKGLHGKASIKFIVSDSLALFLQLEHNDDHSAVVYGTITTSNIYCGGYEIELFNASQPEVVEKEQSLRLSRPFVLVPYKSKITIKFQDEAPIDICYPSLPASDICYPSLPASEMDVQWRGCLFKLKMRWVGDPTI